MYHGGDFGCVERSRKIAECSLAHGSNYISRNPFIREDNHPSVRASTPDSTKEFNVIQGACFTARNDQIERRHVRERKSLVIVANQLNAPAFAGQSSGKRFVNLAPGRNDQHGPLRI
jgi:hypothetical protein